MIALSRLGWLMLFIAPQASAAWLGLCAQTGASQPGTRSLESVTTANGESFALFASDRQIPDCAMTELPIDSAQIGWAKVIAREDADALSGGVILKGIEGDERLGRFEVIPLSEPARAPAALPAGSELIPRLQVQAFGVEARARAKIIDARILIECDAGNAPAGVLLKGCGEVLPAGAGFAARIETDTHSRFRFGAVDAAREKLGEPLPLGSIAPGRARTSFPLPPQLDAASWQSWVVECPKSAARLSIESLMLEPRAPMAAMPRRALWVWHPEAWSARRADLFALLDANAADTVFLTIPVSADLRRVRDPDALANFISAASARGTRIWAVAGDPRAVLPDQRTAYAQRARAYADYNRSVAADARLSGFQLDIEPYLNTGYPLDTEAWLSAYLDTLSQVRAQANMPIDVAVPFWWGRQAYRGGEFLDHLASLVDVVTVMNYRTEKNQILEFAEPFLAWAAHAQRQVRIGLESGPIADESMSVYRSSTEGELWRVPLGDYSLLLLLDKARANPAGSAFAYSHTTRWHGSSITFRDNIGAMHKLLPDLEAVWRSWPSFAGIALHGLDAD